jgi:hypothetical protein
MAQTYKFGNGTWATKDGSTLAYNDENENYKPLPFSFERDSIATKVNKQGLIKVVGKNIPRIDFKDSSNGVFLLEPSRTNLNTHSQDFSNAAWTKGNTVITSNTLVSPDGTINASTLTDNTANTIHRLRDAVSLSSSTDYTLSIFAKKGTLSNIQLALINTANSNTASRVFDLENGILGESLTSGGTLQDSKITDYGNGWYRCAITAQLNSAPNQYQITLATKSIGNATTGNQVTYDGDGNGNVYLWGAMLEQGSYATSYIPTNGATLFRHSEKANGSGNSEVFNDSEGVLFADIAALANDGTFRYMGIFDSQSGNVDRIQIYYRSDANKISFLIEESDSNQFFQSIDADVESYNKCAFQYGGTSKIYINGFLVAEGSGITVPNNLQKLSFNEQDGNDYFYGKTKEIGCYNSILTNAELEYITSYRSLSELVAGLNLNTL